MGGLAMLAAGLTAFYMTRLVIMTFFGEKRWQKLRGPDGKEYHPHESPAVMTVPMIILAVGSVGAGFLLQRGHTLADWLSPTVASWPSSTVARFPSPRWRSAPWCSPRSVC